MTGEFPCDTPLETVIIYEPDHDRWKEGPVIPGDRRRGAAGEPELTSIGCIEV